MSMSIDDPFCNVVDEAIRLGRERAKELGREYDVPYFARAMWTAKPLFEELAPITDEMRAKLRENGKDEPNQLINGPDRALAQSLGEQLRLAVLGGDKAAVGRCITKMRALAESVSIPLPDVNRLPTPKAMQN